MLRIDNYRLVLEETEPRFSAIDGLQRMAPPGLNMNGVWERGIAANVRGPNFLYEMRPS
jgi:hypothetical protein